MTAIQEEHPGIILHINENVGGVISEIIMAGKINIALIYDPGGLPGFSFEPIQTEELYFVSAVALRGGSVCLNSFWAFLKCFSALVMPLPRLAPAD